MIQADLGDQQLQAQGLPYRPYRPLGGIVVVGTVTSSSSSLTAANPLTGRAPSVCARERSTRSIRASFILGSSRVRMS